MYKFEKLTTQWWVDLIKATGVEEGQECDYIRDIDVENSLVRGISEDKTVSHV